MPDDFAELMESVTLESDESRRWTLTVGGVEDRLAGSWTLQPALSLASDALATQYHVGVVWREESIWGNHSGCYRLSEWWVQP